MSNNDTSNVFRMNELDEPFSYSPSAFSYSTVIGSGEFVIPKDSFMVSADNELVSRFSSSRTWSASVFVHEPPRSVNFDANWLLTARYSSREAFASENVTLTNYADDLWSSDRLKEASLRLVELIEGDRVEPGHITEAESFVGELWAENSDATKLWLANLYKDFIDRPSILVALLDVVGHLDYDTVTPSGPVMALAALSHSDVLVKEYGVRCFELWNHPDGIKILESASANVEWLQDYINHVLNQLKEQMTIGLPSAND